MILRLNSDKTKYFCNITTRLDEYAHIEGLDVYKDFDWKHYIYVNKRDIDDRCLCIRIPGGTVGTIEFNEKNIITHISLDTNYVVKSYDRNALKKLRKEFLGQKIEFEEIL